MMKSSLNFSRLFLCNTYLSAHFPVKAGFGYAVAIVICLTLQTSALWAAPMEGQESTYRQPDGTVITLKFYGDEFYARTETPDGYTVVFDPATKTYYYAALSPDGNDFLSSGKQVGKDKPDAGLSKSLRINPVARAAKARTRYDKIEAVVHQEERWEAVKAVNRNYRAFKNEVKKQENAGKKGFAIPLGTIFPDSEIPPVPAAVSPVEGTVGVSAEPPIAPAPPSFTLSGDVVGLTILIDFPDVPGTVVTQAQIDDYCNKPNYTGFSNAGSVYDYFSIQSSGNLRYNNNVTYYVRVPQPKSYYNDTSVADNCGTCGRLLLNDALNILIADGFDFSQVTTKVVSGKNYIRACNVLFAGANSGVWSSGLWPHRSSITAKLVGPNMYVYDYQVTEIGTTASLKIGTVCHENGHMLLGYPDLYSYDGNAANIGSFSLMASSGSTHPVNIDPYLKEASGWMDVIELNSSSSQRCTVQVDGNQVYRYLNPAKATEYFMFEVRDNTGYEGPYGGASGSVNPSAGLVAYHVYETGSNPYSSIWTQRNPTNSYTKPYELLVVEANPQLTKTPWYDDPAPDAADAFKSTGKSYLSDITTPVNLKFWDATGRNTASGCIITNISVDGPTMTFVIGAGALGGIPKIVLSRNTIDSFCDYGSTATSQTFTVCNGQGATLTYTITDNQTWLSCTPTSGTATTESDTITVNFSTSGLAVGSYSATITVTDPAASPTTSTIAVALTVNPQPVMVLSETSISRSGAAKLPGPQASFTINNTGGGAMTYSLSKTNSWLLLSPSSGTVVAETDTIYVDFDGFLLSTGTYYDAITVTSPEAAGSPQVIPVTYTVTNLNMLVTAPNGGEVFDPTTPMNITWLSSIGGTVSIELLKGGVLDTVITTNTTNNGSYSWLIPVSENGTNFHVRITSLDAKPGYADESNSDFTIRPPIAVIAPNGVGDLSAGTQLDITWVSGIGGNVSIELLKGGILSTTIVVNTVNDGNYSWAIPAVTYGNGYRVRITSLDAIPGFSDQSDGDFAILSPPVTLISENFDSSGSIPSGWSQSTVSGSAIWKVQKGGYTGGANPASAHSGTNNMTLYLNSYSNKQRLLSPVFDATGYSALLLNFFHTQLVWPNDQDELRVFFSTNGGSSWSMVAEYTNSISSWTESQISLPDSSVQCQVAFEGNANYGYGVCIDDVIIRGSSSATSVIITHSDGSTAVTEGGANDSYTIVLSQVPADTVTIGITPDVETTVSPTSLIFTVGNWDQPQTVTVTAVDDSDHELNHTGTIQHTASSADPIYDGIQIDNVIVSITDNDNNVPVVYAGDDQTVIMTGASWSPDDVGVQLWLDADDAATLQLNGSTVSNWVDKSGNGRDATQTTSLYQPTDTAAGLNGKHVLTFDGSADYFAVDLDFMAGVTHSAFVVTKPTGYTDIYGAANPSAGSNSLHVGFATGSSSAYRMNYWGNDYGPAVSTNFHVGSGNLLNYIWTYGSTKQILANGSSEATGTGAGVIGPMSGGGRIGQVVNHGYYGGDIAEFIVKTGTVSLADRQLFEGYLAHKWGMEGYLPAGHPYKIASPSGAEATTNLAGSATDADSDPLTIAWSTVSGPAAVAFNNVTSVNAIATFRKEGVYTLRLSASDGGTQVVDEVVITVTTNALPPAIVAPSGLSATAVATNRINLAWTDNSTNETGFAINRSLTNGAGFALIASRAANATNYSDIGLTPGVTYYYTVTATNATDSSTASGQASATTPKIPASVTLGSLSQPYNGSARAVTVTTSPTGLACSVTYSGVSVAPTNAGNYAVVATVNSATYQGSTNGTLVVSKVTPTVSVWPTAASIVEGQSLSTATLSGGSASVAGSFGYVAPATVPPLGPYAAAVTFTPTITLNYNTVTGTVNVSVTEALPDTPTNLQATVSIGQVDLAWGAASGAATYNIKRATSPGGPYATIGVTNVTSYSDATAANGAIYYYVVSAVNSGGESADASEISVTLLHVLPFVENFESLTPGALLGQNLWDASDAVVQTTTAMDAQGGSITSETGFVSQDFAGSNTNVWTDFELQPVFCEDAPTLSDPSVTSWLYFNTNGNPVVYDGTNPVVVASVTITNGVWMRVTIHSDYVARKWSLYINSAVAASDLNFYNAAVAQYTGFKVKGAGATYAALDNVRIDVNSPLIIGFVDVDVDGMDDGWETIHVVNDPNGDADGDGVSNYEEFIAGTNPTNVLQFLRILSISRNVSGQPVVVWASEQDGTTPPRQYRVNRRESLLSGAWTNVASGISSEGVTTDHTDTNAPAATEFYRIEPY